MPAPIFSSPQGIVVRLRMLSQLGNIRKKNGHSRQAIVGAWPSVWSQATAAPAGRSPARLRRPGGNTFEEEVQRPPRHGEPLSQGETPDSLSRLRARVGEGAVSSPRRLTIEQNVACMEAQRNAGRASGGSPDFAARCIRATDHETDRGEPRLRSLPCLHGGAARRRSRRRNRFPVRRGLRSAGCDLYAASAGSPTMAC